jgi:hypothetical protein
MFDQDFKDSYKHITTSLAKMPKMFDIKDVAKDVGMYKFYTAHWVIDKGGKIRPEDLADLHEDEKKNYFIPQDLDLSDKDVAWAEFVYKHQNQKDYLELHDSKAKFGKVMQKLEYLRDLNGMLEKDGVVDLTNETAKYCQQDVKVLSKCMVAYCKMILSQAGIFPLRFLTKPSLFHYIRSARYWPRKFTSERETPTTIGIDLYNMLMDQADGSKGYSGAITSSWFPWCFVNWEDLQKGWCIEKTDICSSYPNQMYDRLFPVGSYQVFRGLDAKGAMTINVCPEDGYYFTKVVISPGGKFICSGSKSTMALCATCNLKYSDEEQCACGTKSKTVRRVYHGGKQTLILSKDEVLDMKSQGAVIHDVKWTVVWKYTRRDLYNKYIEAYWRGKVMNSAPPLDIEACKQEHKDKFGWTDFDPKLCKLNRPLRTANKFGLVAFYGKLAQKIVYRTHEIHELRQGEASSEEWAKIVEKSNDQLGKLFDFQDQGKIKNLRLTQLGCQLQVEFDDHRRGFNGRQLHGKQLAHGMIVTARGRIQLVKYLRMVEKNGCRALYSDTDSVLFLKHPDFKPKDSICLGEWESEFYGERMLEFCSNREAMKLLRLTYASVFSGLGNYPELLDSQKPEEKVEALQNFIKKKSKGLYGITTKIRLICFASVQPARKCYSVQSFSEIFWPCVAEELKDHKCSPLHRHQPFRTTDGKGKCGCYATFVKYSKKTHAFKGLCGKGQDSHSKGLRTAPTFENMSKMLMQHGKISAVNKNSLIRRLKGATASAYFTDQQKSISHKCYTRNINFKRKTSFPFNYKPSPQKKQKVVAKTAVQQIADEDMTQQIEDAREEMFRELQYPTPATEEEMALEDDFI